MLDTLTNNDVRSISAFGLTDIGKRRKVNEDALLLADLINLNFSLGARINTAHLNENGALLGVADGMGGAAAGEVASALVMTTLRNELTKSANGQAISVQLKEVVEKANKRLWEYAQRRPELRGMGTTLTAAIISKGTACIAQVGDSRAYLIRGRNIKQVTKDQSIVQRLLDAGLLDSEEALVHPYRNVLTQALGSEPTVKVALTEFPLCRDDHLLICSDGLSNKINPQEMLQAVQESYSLVEACRQLIEKANERGGEDNITVIMAHFDGDTFYARNEELSTGSFNTIPVAA